MTAVKLRAGKIMIPGSVTKEGDRLFIGFGYNKTLLEEIKQFAGRQWHGNDDANPRKLWSIPITQRNVFQLSYLMGENPYKRYDETLIDINPNRDILRAHQREMVSHVFSRRHCILACEMGTGKTLVAIEVLEKSGFTDWIYCGPKSAIKAVEYEFEKWNAKVRPKFVTYDGLKKMVADGFPTPHGVIYDESSRLKNPTAQRTQAAQYVADAIRNEYGYDSFIVLMSGSPAPKSPIDWWSQCEIARPGFLREGDIHKFRNRLAVVIQKESQAAGSYPALVTWRDNDIKCQECGELPDSPKHDQELGLEGTHKYVKGSNEVSKLYSRMNGLVLVKFKRDCTELPEKQFKVITVKPTRTILNAAKLIAAKGKSAAVTLTLLRELSDGFQYEDTEFGTETCPLCKGSRTYTEYYTPEGEAVEYEEGCKNYKARTAACPYCNGTGEVVKTVRGMVEVPCPKDDILKEQLDLHEEIGRFVVYAGFQGSVDRCVRIAKSQGWSIIRADGRGWYGEDPSGHKFDNKRLLNIFQDEQDTHQKVVFIGQAGAAGLGLNLTASPTILFFSNTFDGEARIQAVDRIHRLGMNLKLGATIIDIEHLPTDRFVKDNLDKKIKLQDMSMGQLRECLENVETER